MEITKEEFKKLKYNFDEYFIITDIFNKAINFSNDNGNIGLACFNCNGVVNKETTLIDIVNSFEKIELSNYKDETTLIISDY